MKVKSTDDRKSAVNSSAQLDGSMMEESNGIYVQPRAAPVHVASNNPPSAVSSGFFKPSGSHISSSSSKSKSKPPVPTFGSPSKLTAKSVTTATDHTFRSRKMATRGQQNREVGKIITGIKKETITTRTDNEEEMQDVSV